LKVRPSANPDRLNNVKGVIMKLFKQHGGAYRDVTLARKLAANLDSLARLLHCKSFRRFAERVAGQPL
jgi:hypothetical protein